jgi:predicted dehydrogenase
MPSRRSFLQQITASAIALSVLPRLGWAANIPSLSPVVNPGGYPLIGAAETVGAAEGQVLRVAIMGLGSYGTRVAEAMQTCTRAKLVGVISGTPSKVKDWQSRYNIPEQNCYDYSNYDRIRDNPNIDAVYVILPNALHHDAVIRVAKAGKQVICEKPMAVNAKEGQEMVDACKAANVRLLVGYRMHFEPHTLEIIRMRKAGDFGRIRFFQGLSGFIIGDPTQWRLNPTLSGGGSMMDIGIYSINGSRYMTGEEPIWVTAEETKTDPVKFKEGIDETIQFQLGFPSGAVASCLSTYNMNFLDRFFLDGEKGFAELDPATGYGPIQGRTNLGPIDQPSVTHQTVQLDEMARLIFDGKQPVVPADGDEAVRDLTIIDAIYRAARTGKRVVL